MIRVLNLICGIFLALGVTFSGLTIYFVRDTQAFVERGVAVRGEVVDLNRERSISGSPGSGVYHPIVKYTTTVGEQRTFRGMNGSSPPSYRVGEAVDVLYDRTNPVDARIASFWSLWLIQSMFGVLGAVFSLIGGGVFFARVMMARQARDLKHHGTPVETEFQNVEVNGGFKVNGRAPWRIVSRWLDPGRNALYLYHSENLWFDPTPFIRSKHVTVFIDPRNPKRYSMDVSFLPKPAN
jgi:hypothetical protein